MARRGWLSSACTSCFEYGWCRMSPSSRSTASDADELSSSFTGACAGADVAGLLVGAEMGIPGDVGPASCVKGWLVCAYIPFCICTGPLTGEQTFCWKFCCWKPSSTCRKTCAGDDQGEGELGPCAGEDQGDGEAFWAGDDHATGEPCLYGTAPSGDPWYEYPSMSSHSGTDHGLPSALGVSPLLETLGDMATWCCCICGGRESGSWWARLTKGWE